MNSAGAERDEQVRPEARASRSRSSRSNPTAPPSAGRDRRAAASDLGRPSVGDAIREEHRSPPAGAAASSSIPAAARSSSPSSCVAVERHLLGRRLHLDEPAVAGHDDVHVDVGARVLRVVEVEQRLAVDDADRHGGDRARQRLREAEAVERPLRGDVRAGDRGAARAAVGLEHVAVEADRPLAERLEVDDRRAARGRSAAGSRPCGRPACRAPPRARCARRSTPAAASTRPSSSRGPSGGASAARRPSTDAVQSTRVLPCDQSTDPVRLLEERRVGDDRPQLVGPPAVVRASRRRPLELGDARPARRRRAATAGTARRARGRARGRRWSGSGTRPRAPRRSPSPCAPASRRPRAPSPRPRRRASRRGRRRAGRPAGSADSACSRG